MDKNFKPLGEREKIWTGVGDAGSYWQKEKDMKDCIAELRKALSPAGDADLTQKYIKEAIPRILEKIFGENYAK